MIAGTVVDLVRQLLADGTLSQRKIAKLTGVSRGSVAAIASGRRPDYAERVPSIEEEEPTGPPERCPVCGGMVFMPCKLCQTRQAMAEDRRLRSKRGMAETPEWIEFDLRPEHRARYEEVRAWREQQELVEIG